MTRSEKQVLITGCYRTGTEYISLLLGNSPEISVSMYIVSFMRFCYGRYDPIEERSNYNKLIFDVGDRIRIRWNKKLSIYEILDYCDGCGEVNYAVLYDLIMCDLFLDRSVHQWAEKAQLVWTKIPAFLDMFPEGKAVLVIRDPRSVLASFRNFTHAPASAYLGAAFNCLDSMSKGIKYKEKFGPGKLCIVKYEDIVFKPEKTLINLFEFLNLSADHDLLSEEGWVDERGKPWKHNSVFMKPGSRKMKFDKKSAAYRWKKHLSREEIAFCEAINGDLMEKFGYEPSGISVAWPDMIKPVLQDQTLALYLNKWLSTGEGVEAFPTDPLDPKNWSEVVLRQV